MSQNFFDLKRLHVLKNQALILKQLKRDQIRYIPNNIHTYSNIYFRNRNYTIYFEVQFKLFMELKNSEYSFWKFWGNIHWPQEKKRAININSITKVRFQTSKRTEIWCFNDSAMLHHYSHDSPVHRGRKGPFNYFQLCFLIPRVNYLNITRYLRSNKVKIVEF